MDKFPATDENEKKIIVTKGDALSGSIHTLARTKDLSTCMSKSLKELILYVKSAFDDDERTKRLLTQIRVISDGSNQIEVNINLLAKLEGGVDFINKVSSRSNADMNVALKREAKLKPRTCTKPSFGPNISKLKSVLKSTKPTIRIIPKAILNKKRKAVSVSQEPILPTPKNGECYTLREAFTIIDKLKISPSRFYTLATSNPMRPLIACGRSTMFRKYNMFKISGVLPLIQDEGLNVGRPRLVAIESMKSLNEDISNTVSYAEGEDDFGDKIVTLKDGIDEERGLFASSKEIDSRTKKLYQLISCKDNPDIHLVNYNTTMNKCKRRQMASTSIRNLISHIAAVAYSNFIFVADEWEQPKNLSKGAVDFINLIEKVIGSHIKPIHPAFLLNEDCSSQYYYAGTSIDSKNTTKMGRVDTQSLVDRNKSSIWRNADTEDVTCKGIRVKFACGGSGCGFVYPIVIVVSGLTKDELPEDEFLVIPIEGLSINGDIDPRNREVGYMCCCGAKLPQKHFFDWFYENVTCPTISEIRRRYNPFRTEETTDVPPSEFVTMWGDSDIPYLQQMTEPGSMKKAMSRGIYFSKIGAKITETAQPLDLGPFFKILKVNGRLMTSTGRVTPLTLSVDYIFKNLAKEKKLVLSTIKGAALKDLICTAPQMFASAFNKDTMINAFVDSGMLDKKAQLCPDLYGIINSFKVNWDKIPGGKAWLMKMIPLAILEVYKSGEVSEEFYNTNNFPLDCDKDGNTWYLKSNADHLTRSKVLHHPMVILKKKNDILSCLRTKRMKDNKLNDAAKSLLSLNRDCEKQLLSQLNLPVTTVISAEVFEGSTLSQFFRCNVSMLSAFYKVRMLHNLTDKLVLPKKGTIDEAVAGIIDKKSNGLLLLSLAFNIRRLPKIGTVPILPPMVIPEMFIKPPMVVTFESSCISAPKESIDVDWMLEVHDKVASLRQIGSYVYKVKYEEELESHIIHATTMSKKILKRLHPFLVIRLPQSKIELMPGIHWVWNSLRLKSLKLSMLMIMSGHVVDNNDINCRSDDESLLSNHHNFVNTASFNDTEDYDGSYIVLDGKRFSFIRAGAAATGMMKRWKEHIQSSKRISDIDRKSRFYSSYPSLECENENLPCDDEILGNFSQLQQCIGIGFGALDSREVVGLFTWTQEEISALSSLKSFGTNATMIDKQYRHICYLCEAMYALSINQDRNISSNPGCEWQLGYYGN